ncbi:MAG TPA: hypothetical protein VEC37_06330 [Bacillota bacterium]|nr:hypothetical protein [Bacillota bacterium]
MATTALSAWVKVAMGWGRIPVIVGAVMVVMGTELTFGIMAKRIKKYHWLERNRRTHTYLAAPSTDGAGTPRTPV